MSIIVLCQRIVISLHADWCEIWPTLPPFEFLLTCCESKVVEQSCRTKGARLVWFYFKKHQGHWVRDLVRWTIKFLGPSDVKTYRLWLFTHTYPSKEIFCCGDRMGLFFDCFFLRLLLLQPTPKWRNAQQTGARSGAAGRDSIMFWTTVIFRVSRWIGSSSSVLNRSVLQLCEQFQRQTDLICQGVTICPVLPIPPLAQATEYNTKNVRHGVSRPCPFSVWKDAPSNRGVGRELEL